jgi:hypothetical protein
MENCTYCLRYNSFPTAKELKIQLLAGKVMPTLFWGSQAHILIPLLKEKDHGQSMHNTTVSFEMMLNTLRLLCAFILLLRP